VPGRRDTLVFGRVTYLGMAEYWTTDEAIADNPGDAPIINAVPKVAVSATMTPDDATWGPTEGESRQRASAGVEEVVGPPGDEQEGVPRVDLAGHVVLGLHLGAARRRTSGRPGLLARPRSD
jgi:hypothetical protein